MMRALLWYEPAQALAVASLGETDREKIGPGIERNAASRTVLGPGTGLGVAGLVYARHSWIPVPGTTTPDPDPVETDSEAAFPSASTTEM